MITRGFRPVSTRTPAAVLVLALATAALFAACDKVPLTAPSESTITLFANGSSVPVNGSIVLTAAVTESAGTPVQNGTVVSFSTTLGHIDPAEARTHDGKVTVRLVSDGQSGTATVTAFSGGNTSDPLDVPIGGAAANNIVLRAEPASLGGNGGSVTLIATVRDEAGNPLPGVPVTFSTTAGQLSATTATTDQNGEARVTLTSSEQADVTARAGSQSSDALTIPVNAGPTVAIQAPTTPIVAGQPASFTITVTAAGSTGGTGGTGGGIRGIQTAAVQSVSISWGDGATDSLGNQTGTITAQHTYTSSGNFTVTVTARDVTGQQSTAVALVSVTDAPPLTANLTPNPQSAAVNTPVNFTVDTPNNTNIASYTWNFGDGSASQTTTGNTNAHSYGRTGNFNVSVRVRAQDGTEGTARTVVTITP